MLYKRIFVSKKDQEHGKTTCCSTLDKFNTILSIYIYFVDLYGLQEVIISSFTTKIDKYLNIIYILYI